MEAKAEKTTKAPKAAAKTAEAPAKKAAAPKKAAAAGTITVVQHGSVTGIKPGMRETLIGLGLGKPRARRELQDTPAIRGMIRKVAHLVHVEGEGCCKCCKKK